MDLEKLSKYNLTFKSKDEENEVFKFENPVLNGMFHGFGLPIGKVVQFCAESGCGKSTLLLQMAKEICDAGKTVLYIDTENGLNMPMLNNLGLSDYINTKFISIKENDCTKINNLLNTIVDDTDIDFVFIDSLAALDSGIYSLGGTEANNPKVGGNARSLKIIMNTINSCTIQNSKLTFVLVNHVAKEIGSFIPTTNVVGGTSSVYMSDFVIQLYKKGAWKIGDFTVGQKVSFETLKSRWGVGKCKVEFYIMFGYGINLIPTYKDLLTTLNTTFEGKDTKYIVTRGGGNGSLYLNNTEYKFRGDKQLFDVISQHFAEIHKIFMNFPELFMVKIPEEVNKSLVVGTVSKAVSLGQKEVVSITPDGEPRPDLPKQSSWGIKELRKIKVLGYEKGLPIIFKGTKNNHILYDPIANSFLLWYYINEPGIYDTYRDVTYQDFLDITANMNKKAN